MPELTLRLEKEPGGRTGISIRKEGEKASPLLWLDNYYDRYKNGQPLNETINAILLLSGKLKEGTSVTLKVD